MSKEIAKTENQLKNILKEKIFNKIKDTININQNICDWTLKQWKIKKFNFLKFKHKSTYSTTLATRTRRN